MIRLANRGTGDVLGTIQEADLEVMRKALEEEGEDDRDYYVVEQTLETLAEQGLSSNAQSLLRNAFSDGTFVRLTAPMKWRAMPQSICVLLTR